ncbi:hypothetical protein, partial [Stakelama pacifica]|uniref:hypothetical protein n=1 Tax=Stakelama pacifica TaxID=517720 RepID=UPI001667B6A0
FADAVNRFRDGLRHINERWKNALALNNAGLVEQYLSGRFTVALYFHSTGAEVGNPDLAALRDDPGSPTYAIVVVVSDVEEGQCLGDENGDEQSVFVADIELVEVPEKAPAGFVRSYLVRDEGADTWDRFLYGSVPALTFGLPVNDFWRGSEGRYKFFPRFVHREGEAGVSPTENLANYVIEGGAKIVYRIPQGEHDRGWERIDGHDANALSAFRLILNH